MNNNNDKNNNNNNNKNNNNNNMIQTDDGKVEKLIKGKLLRFARKRRLLCKNGKLYHYQFNWYVYKHCYLMSLLHIYEIF